MAEKSAGKKENPVTVGVLIAVIAVGGGALAYQYLIQPAMAPRPGATQTNPVPGSPAAQPTSASIQTNVTGSMSQSTYIGEEAFATMIKTGRHNPFVPLEEDISSTKNRTEVLKNVERQKELKKVTRSQNLKPWEFRVLGIVASRANFIALLDTRDGNYPVVAVGDNVYGYIINRIDANGVELGKDGESYYLKLGEG
ncbi:MAG: hypothetical protein ACM3WV_11860 [Bacillota bacterium]